MVQHKLLKQKKGRSLLASLSVVQPFFGAKQERVSIIATQGGKQR